MICLGVFSGRILRNLFSKDTITYVQVGQNYKNLKNSEDSLKMAILFRGTVSSYNHLKERVKHPYDIFYYALIMANKYGYKEANYDVYNTLVSIYKDNPALGSMDSISNRIAIEYLKKGVECGDIKSINEIKKYLKTNINNLQ